MTTPGAEVPGSHSGSLKLPGLSGIPGGSEAALRKNSSSQLPSSGLSVSSSHLPVGSSGNPLASAGSSGFPLASAGSSGYPMASTGSSGYPLGSGNNGHALARSLPRDAAPIAGAPLAFDQLIPESIKNKLSTSSNGLDKGGQIIGSQYGGTWLRYFFFNVPHPGP
jgi:hypothetical protein